MTNILENIIRIRNEKGLSQEEMADILGIPQSSYSKLENGRKKSIPYEYLVKMAEKKDVFNMTVIDIITYPIKYIPEEMEAKVNNANSIFIVTEHSVETLKDLLNNKTVQILTNK